MQSSCQFRLHMRLDSRLQANLGRPRSPVGYPSNQPKASRQLRAFASTQTLNSRVCNLSWPTQCRSPYSKALSQRAREWKLIMQVCFHIAQDATFVLIPEHRLHGLIVERSISPQFGLT